MKNNVLTIGTRGSALALWQTEFVSKHLRRTFPKLEIIQIIITTTGDKNLSVPLADIGDKGLFTKEIEDALLAHRIDLAVHSLKDLPTKIPTGLTIAAVGKRADVRDALLVKDPRIRSVAGLPEGAVVATGSLRRTAQLLHLRPDIEIQPMRGNVPTRIEKFLEGNYDAMILAAAGLKRLGMSEHVAQYIPANILLPAVGQGAIAVETRSRDKRTSALVQKAFHDKATSDSVTAERALLRELEGGCQVPIGAHAKIIHGTLYLDAIIARVNGTILVRGHEQGKPRDAEKIGKTLAKRLYKEGGKEILEELRNI